MQAVLLLLLSGLLLGRPGFVEDRPPAPRILFAKSLPELDKRFQRTEGWTGGDGVHSVVLAPQKTLYLFSDTWVGKILNNKHTDATIVNNTLAIQDGHGDQANLQFIVRRDPAGKPTALITPSDGKGWFWLQAGAMVQGKLLLFLPQFEKTSDPGVFGFKCIGLWIGVVDNPLEKPTTWRITQTKIPCTLFSPRRELTWGCALLSAGEYLYIYGTDEDVFPKSRKRHLIVARARLSDVTDPARWEFFSQGAWQRDYLQVSRLADEMGSEAGVIYLPDRQEYLLVYSQNGLSARVRGRLAKQPWGPWSPPTTLFECPEMSWDKRIFTYAAKVHACLSQGDTIVFSYVANTFDFAHLVNDARLYWPRFVEVKLAK